MGSCGFQPKSLMDLGIKINSGTLLSFHGFKLTSRRWNVKSSQHLTKLSKKSKTTMSCFVPYR